MRYEYVNNAKFKQAIKQDKSVSVPIQKIINGMPTVVADRQIKFIFSTPAIDRDYDLIVQDGIDLSWFKTNPLVFWGHEHDTQPIGKCVSVGLENGNLVGIIQFVPADNTIVGAKAEGIFQLCRDGYLSTVSIGFIPREVVFPKDKTRSNNDGVDVITCEMVEVSIVGIPSQRAALIQEVGTPADEPIFEVPTDIPTIIDISEPTKTYRAARLKRILACLD
jgi:hypothetical protein